MRRTRAGRGEVRSRRSFDRTLAFAAKRVEFRAVSACLCGVGKSGKNEVPEWSVLLTIRGRQAGKFQFAPSSDINGPPAFFAWGAAIEGAGEIKTGSMARLLPRRVGA